MSECPGKMDSFLENWDAADPEEIQLTLRTNEEKGGDTGRKGEKPETSLDNNGSPSQAAAEEEKTGCMKNGRKLILIILVCLLFSAAIGLLTALFLTVMHNQSLKKEIHQITEDMLSARNKNEELRQRLNSSYENFTIAVNENYQQNLLLNATQSYVAVLSNENAHLTERLNVALQEKAQMQMDNAVLHATVDNYRLVEEKNQQLMALLNKSLHHISVASAENEKLRVLLNNELQTSASLEATNQQQRSILHSNLLSFIWSLCNEDTLQCSRCLPGWVEHASRCFLLHTQPKNWEDARRDCLNMHGDLAMVLNADDQAFLTNMTFQFIKNNPQKYFHSAWIGLQDMVKEGVHLWIDGSKIRLDVSYWKTNEPNNAIASWDTERAGQDCVAIVPPRSLEIEGWLNSWDDITCRGERHYVCQRPVLVLP